MVSECRRAVIASTRPHLAFICALKVFKRPRVMNLNLEVCTRQNALSRLEVKPLSDVGKPVTLLPSKTTRVRFGFFHLYFKGLACDAKEI